MALEDTKDLLAAMTLENEALRQQLATFLPPPAQEGGRGGGGTSSVSSVGSKGHPRPPLYLVLNAIGKDKNIGSLLRTAVAFGVKEVCVCGANARSVTTFGAKGTERYGTIRDFPGRGGLEACSQWLREQGVALIGLEITKEAVPITSKPFTGPTAIMPGNETLGLTEAQKALCDGFTYIPQYGNGTASLNVAAATAIALHSFASWAGYVERPREAGVDKFFVDAAEKRVKGEVSEEQRAAIQAERALERGVDGLGDYYPPVEF